MVIINDNYGDLKVRKIELIKELKRIQVYKKP